jgi:hypothetical protein
MSHVLSFRAAVCAATVVALGLLPAPSSAQSRSAGVPKQVHLVVDRNSLMASNVRLNRFDELKLNAQERIRDRRVGEAVIIVITNQRIIAYGVVSGWRSRALAPNEQIESIAAEDYAGLVVTSRRLLNFNGETGVWAQHDRATGR